MNRIVHFEIHSDDPESTRRFFDDVFGWRFTRWDGPEEYWLADTGPGEDPGINGGLMRSDDRQPRIVNTLQVSSVDRYTARVIQHGGRIVTPKVAIPKVGYVAYCQDPRGVIFGIFQDDPSAG